MPTDIAEPTIAELLEAFGDGIRIKRDRYVDAREGAIYQHWGGAAAVLWSREAHRDTDLWRAIYIDSAEAKDLTSLLADRYDFDRVLDDYGTGVARLRRETAAAGAGTVWRGTRINTIGTITETRQYVVAADTPMGATALAVDVPIRATTTGKGTAISVDIAGRLRVDDPLWDATLYADTLECSDGTSFEAASAARARLRDVRRTARPGFVEALIAACKANGAENALFFTSDYAGDDQDGGLNIAFVGDGGFNGDLAMCRKIAIALEGTRVLGDQLQVRPMTRANVTLSARVYLWDSPTRVAQEDVLKRLTGAVSAYFGTKTDGFSYQLDAISGAMMKASPEVQFVEFLSPTSDAGVVSLVDGAMNFPAVLPRYFLAPNDITLELLPPL